MPHQKQTQSLQTQTRKNQTYPKNASVSPKTHKHTPLKTKSIKTIIIIPKTKHLPTPMLKK